MATLTRYMAHSRYHAEAVAYFRLQYGLNAEQAEALFSAVVERKNLFITGGAGTGKSYLLNAIRDVFEKQNIKVCVCAPTGQAANNVDGETIHSLFHITKTGTPIFRESEKDPIPCLDVSKIEKAKVLIVDEISMVRMDFFDSIIYSLLQTDLKIQIIIFGDFCQLPPVLPVQNGERNYLQSFYAPDRIGKAFAFQAFFWKKCNFKYIELKQVIRQDGYDELIASLNKLRVGDASGLEYFRDCTAKTHIPNGVLLSGKNSRVNEVNAQELNKISEKAYAFKTRLRGKITWDDVTVPRKVILKRGARVVVTANNRDAGYYNGLFGWVEDFSFVKKNVYDDYGRLLYSEPVPVVEVYADDGRTYSITEARREKRVYICVDRKTKKFKEKIVGSCTYMPLRLGYAMTIHKAQGLTLPAVNVEPKCWDSGQLYCALSRCTSPQGIHLESKINPKDLKLDSSVKKFYKEISRC